MTDHAGAMLLGNITVGTRRQYAEQSLKWDAAVASEKSDDELLQRIWNLAEDSLALVAALDALVADLRDWLGCDQYGLWGVFTNATIWAIPVKEVS